MKRTPLTNAILSGVLSLGLIMPVFAQTYNGQPLQGRITYVPVGTVVDATLTSPIDSAIARPGDIFNAKLYAPLYLGSDMVLPANTTLEGQVASADKSGLVGTSGKITLRLTAAVTPDGIRYPLSALISANQAGPGVHPDSQGNLKGRTTSSAVKSSVLRTAAWTGAGTLLGIIFAPIVAGSVGAGAIAGVATGGGIGLASNLWRKGKDVRIPSGTRVQFALDQPMSLAVNGPGTAYR